MSSLDLGACEEEGKTLYSSVRNAYAHLDGVEVTKGGEEKPQTPDSLRAALHCPYLMEQYLEACEDDGKA